MYLQLSNTEYSNILQIIINSLSHRHSIPRMFTYYRYFSNLAKQKLLNIRLQTNYDRPVSRHTINQSQHFGIFLKVSHIVHQNSNFVIITYNLVFNSFT